MTSVVILCKTLLKGGAEKQALTLSKLLSEKGINVILISWSGSQTDSSNLDFVRNNDIRFIALKGSSLKKLNTFLRILKKEQISIILSYLTNANFVAGISKLLNKNLITIGGIRNETLPFHKCCIEKFVHNYLNDGTVFNNFSGKGKLELKGFNPQKIHVIHNTIHLAPADNFPAKSDVINIISVCRFVKFKDLPTAIYAFKKLLDKTPDKIIKYLIVGYGPLESEIRHLVRKLDLQNNVEILVNPPDIARLFKISHIYLSTSRYEGLSNSIMEAMLAGIPIVATDVGDNRFLVKDGYNGFLVPYGETDQIVDKLEYLANMEEIRNEFGRNSYSILENDFSEEKFLENYLKLFSRMSLPLNIVTPSIK